MIHTIYSQPGDMFATLQGTYLGCHDGDTIQLIPHLNYPFKVSKTVDWTGKNVNVIATGATLYSTFVGPCILYGAPLGHRAGGLSWVGGNIQGGLVLQNIGYSTFDITGIIGDLELRLDTVLSYNDFRITSMAGSIVVNQLNNTAWTNQIRFDKSNINPNNSVLIKQINKAGYGLGLWQFDVCNFEGTAQLMDTGSCGPTFRDCYWEGSWSLGSSETPASIVFVRPQGNPWWVGTPIIVVDAGA